MTKPIGIELMKQIATERGGECLSDVYVNNKSNLKFKCSEGHEFVATAHHVKNSGSWCPTCGGTKRLTLKHCQEIAESRGGKCLSKKYVNSRNKLFWQCSELHVWNSTVDSIKYGKKWCPHCYGNFPLTLEDLQKVAEERNGKCISRIYKNNYTKVLWECSKKHIWKATPHSIKNSSRWCPRCSQSKTEKLVRKEFEKIFGVKFPTKKPKWLINPKTGRRMQLDGWSKRKAICFEYDGRQHQEYIPNLFHKNKREFEEQKYRDRLKDKLCEENNVLLIRIPYPTKISEVKELVIKKLKEKG